MHFWDIVKTETQSMDGNNMTYEPTEVRPSNMLLARTMAESIPTSPHSLASDDSVAHNHHMYMSDHIQSLINGNNLHRPLGFNPLTPPGYPNVRSPQTGAADFSATTSQQIHPTTPTSGFTKTDVAFSTASLTPRYTPPMDETPPKSPKGRADDSEKECTDLENSSQSSEDSKSSCSDYFQDISQPKVNSHGKMKTHKCKHCNFISITKREYWLHVRMHIKPEKQILCTKCEFVTEYKHHFEYHTLNHSNSKPFKCDECNYTCVNKSMLNSHLKSHSNIFQYRCRDCSYVTKYVHSLKLHLRKYTHLPGHPLDQFGQPAEIPHIDVYGTRRGPKKGSRKTGAKAGAKARSSKQAKPQEDAEAVRQKKLQKEQEEELQMLQQVQLEQQQLLQQQLQEHRLLQQSLFHRERDHILQCRDQLQRILPSLLPNLPDPVREMLPYLSMQMMAAQTQARAIAQHDGGRGDIDDTHDGIEIETAPPNDRLKFEPNNAEPSTSTSSMTNSNKNFHLQMPENATASSSDMSNDSDSTNFNPDAPNTIRKSHYCKFCGIRFKDPVLHTIHMGYHEHNDVFTCNMCGHKCHDAISFHIHIAKAGH